MTSISLSSPTRLSNVWRLFTLTTILTFGVTAVAQMNNTTDGGSPRGVAPGAPAGSYSLSGLENFNSYSGHLGFSVPVLQLGGRGGAQVVLPVRIDSPAWTVTHDRIISEQLNTTTHIYFAEDGWWNNFWDRALNPGGRMVGRYTGNNATECMSNGDPTGIYHYNDTRTTITFTAPDGTEYELRDTLTGGGVGNGGCWIEVLRGKVFSTKDGTAATFISDEDIYDQRTADDPAGTPESHFDPTGLLLLRDGTRYRINLGRTEWVRDRNGNQITFHYNGILTNPYKIVDSLGREVFLDYDYADVAPYGVCDRIRFKGVNGVDRIVRISYASLSSVLRSDYSSQTHQQLFPQLNGTGSFNPSHMVKAIWLPDGRSYQFRYNPYNELAKVTLPTGGVIEYDYAGGELNGTANGVVGAYLTQRWHYGTGGTTYPRIEIYRRLVQRRSYPSGSGLPTTTTTYSKVTYGNNPNTWDTPAGPDASVTISEFGGDATGTELSRTQQLFHGNPMGSMLNKYPLIDPLWNEGREYRNDSLNPINSAVLRRSAQTWADAPMPGGPRVTDRTTSLMDVSPNLVAKQAFLYDQYNNVTDAREYDHGTGVPLTHPLRHVHSDYLTVNSVNGIDYTGTDVHIRNLTRAQQIYSVNPSSGVETLVAQSETKFDETALQPWYGAVQSWIDPGSRRGNPTRVRAWLNPGNSWLEMRAQFDQVGNVTKSWDAKNTHPVIPTTEIAYSATWHFAYPTQSTSAVPDPTGQFGSTTALVTSSAYDFFTGLVTSTTDANGQITSILYGDVLDRPTQVIRAVGTLAQNQTTFGYNDVTRINTTTTDLNAPNDNLLKSETLYDGLGRTIETRHYEGGTNYIAVQQTPFVMQQDPDTLVWLRASQSSNPYRPYLGEQPVWTTSFFDALGQIVKLRTHDTAIVRSVYSGNQVTVTDQEGKARKSVTDGLGRLKQIYEDPAGLNYLTSYSYDALDNLVTVVQAGQTRTFVYDSLKRLTSATNPEVCNQVGAQCTPIPVIYQYDKNGNLEKKTDARGISIDYTYDVLNRNTQVNYSDSTPDSFRKYDLASNGRGRINEVWQSGTTTSATYIDSYDAVGRPLVQRQRFETGGVWSSSYQVSRAYNLAGAVTSQTYPSGRTVGYGYDTAGRTISFTGNLGDGVSRTYSTAILYSPFGGLAMEQFGTNTPIYSKSFYNNRGQLGEIRISTYHATDQTWWNRGAIINHYSNAPGAWGATGGGPDNNGNLKKQEVYIPHNDQITSHTTWWQRYDYDNLNRLKRVAEIVGSPVWQQEYEYDQWGNRKIHQTNTWGPGGGQPLIPKPNFGVNTGNNRLTPPAGFTMTYDSAGNLTNDTYTGAGSRTYDAENRMTQAFGGASQQQYYTYNADGQRVRRRVDGVETWQVYGIDGELFAEYAVNAPSASPQKEYGYRNGQLLITAAGRTENVTWTNAVGVSVSGNSLTKTAAAAWGNGGASSTQALISGDGYVEFTASEPSTSRMCGLSNGDSNQNYTDVDFAFYPTTGGGLQIYEAGLSRGVFGTYAVGDRLRVAVEGGVVKYRKNGALLYTSSVNETYPLLVDTALHTTGSTVMNVVVSGNLSTNGGTEVSWLVADHLGTPRMIIDKTGTLASVKRHDYLPFGEELSANQGLRTTALGYTGDLVRHKFTQKERDSETNLDYFLARYYSSRQGRFTSPDEFRGGPNELYVLGTGDDTRQALPYAEITNPQSINKYSYAYNNPLRFIDPDGHQAKGKSIYDYLMEYLGRIWKAQSPQDGMVPGGGNGEIQKREQNGPLDADPNKLANDATLAVGRDLDTYAEIMANAEPTGMGNFSAGWLKNDPARSAFAVGGLALPKGLRLERLFSGAAKRLEVAFANALGGPRSVEVTSHTAGRLIDRVFGGELKGVTFEQLGTTLAHAPQYFKDKTTGSFIALRKNVAIAFSIEKRKVVIRTIENGNNVKAGERFIPVQNPF